ncbi:MAG: universal stress protein [Candidatus Protistobacter heckmanni]|nr:universal stress protein [Candidatus Protistobacter heckmanni]
MFKHILIPTDGSELSQKAAEAGVALAKSLGAKITAYASMPEYPYAPMTEFVVETPSSFHDRVKAEAEANLGDVAALAKSAGIAYNSDSSESPVPYSGIIEAAKRNGCDLILMASHGRSGLSAVLLGSETQKVLTHSTIPVLVYR